MQLGPAQHYVWIITVPGTGIARTSAELMCSSASGLGIHDYTVGWVCALHTELAASRAMLDEVHDTSWLAAAAASHRDSNTYVLGSIGAHNVAMACLPADAYGTTSAATVAGHMMRTFPALRTRLMVGIGGGVPTSIPGCDIRLGDVVVSTKVWQYDLGKTVQDGAFQRTGVSWRPPADIMTAVQVLKSRHEVEGHRIAETVAAMVESHPAMAKYAYPQTLRDCVFQPEYDHKLGMPNCESCDPSRILHRPRRAVDRPQVHYGCIASGNQVMRHAVTRDEVARENKVLCFEMEAAGLMDSFACLVIRGICDYADSHKNKKWQEYASATAAAYATELLSVVTAAQGRDERPVQMQMHLEIAQRRKLLTDSLAFPEMRSRQTNIKEPLATTCEWVLRHPDYRNWTDPEQYAQHRGFWWIKGKPGAGKSTLIKFLLGQVKDARTGPGGVILSFFFNARGNTLEQSVLGMYRSFLYHLFTENPALQEAFDDTVSGGPRPTWTVVLLQELLSHVVAKLGSQQLTLFIDALDECDQEQVQEMLSYFESLGDRAIKYGTKVYVCFSSRHYPYVHIQYGRELVLESQAGHRQDLETFVRSSLAKAGTGMYVDEVANEILQKANGVFVWVSLVVEIVKKEFQNGRIFAVRKRLQEMPARLKDLFKHILARDGGDSNDLLLCVQWLLFAKRPLGPKEFYFALVSGLDADPRSIGCMASKYISSADCTRFVLSSSKGLAQVTKAIPHTVEFIHESVRDFFLRENGLCELWPHLSTHFHSQSHERLKWCCFSYIKVNANFALYYAAKNTSHVVSLRLRPVLPFLEYATQYVLSHADAAAQHVQQLAFLQSFDVSLWSRLEDIYSSLWSKKRHNLVDSSLLCQAATKNWVYLIRAELSRRPPGDVRAGPDRYALVSAWESNHHNAFNALLQQSPRPGTQRTRFEEAKLMYTDQFHMPLTCEDLDPLECMIEEGRAEIAASIINARTVANDDMVHQALESGRETLAKLLLAKEEVDCCHKNWYHASPLELAASQGFEEVVSLILTEKGNDYVFDSRLGRATIEGHMAMSKAIEGGHPHIVKLLLQARVPPDIFLDDRTALTAACQIADADTAAVLIDFGAEVNLQDKSGATPLSEASANELVDIVRILLQKGALINARGPDGSTPIFQAVRAMSEPTVRLLLLAGADVRCADTYETTPLAEAAKIGGERAIIELMLTAGALVDYQDEAGKTPLMYAVASDCHAVVKILIQAGANVNIRDDDGNTALLQSIGPDNRAILQMLINAGADVNCRNAVGSTPLLEASKLDDYGYHIVEALLSAGAWVNCQDNKGQTPLMAAAVAYDSRAVVEILIRAGADVHLRDNHGATALSIATDLEDADIIPVLINAGAVASPDTVAALSPQTDSRS